MNPIFWVLGAGGIVLQLLLLHVMFTRAFYRRFPAVFVFAIIVFLTSVVDASFLFEVGQWTRNGAKFFWINDLVRQFFFATAVVGLIYQALEESPRRGAWRRALIVLAIGVAAVSAILHNTDSTNKWLTSLVRDISFFALLINLFLWTSLMRSPRADRLMLMLSCGVGLQMAGEAIGQSLRAIGMSYAVKGLIEAGNAVLVLANLSCMFVWWLAFHRHAPTAVRTPTTPTASL